jgi:hypothetical protein
MDHCLDVAFRPEWEAELLSIVRRADLPPAGMAPSEWKALRESHAQYLR